MRYHLELTYTKEILRLFVAIAFLTRSALFDDRKIARLSKQLQQCKHLPLGLSEVLYG